MRIFFITIWSTTSGLSFSTVHPHLTQLACDLRVKEIIYFSLEQSAVNQYIESTGKVKHIPILQRSLSVPLWSRVSNTLEVWRVIDSLSLQPPHLVICRGAPAGIYGHYLFKKYGTPYYVESFEPHAEYMRQSGTWSRFSIKYHIQTLWESKIKNSAKGLITVSDAYSSYLIEHEGIFPERLFNVPCWVDDNKFIFNNDARQSVRKKLGIGESLTCIYVGKFGGIYHDISILENLFKFRSICKKNLYIIVLTPDDKNLISSVLRREGFSDSEFFVDFVPFEKVNDYLSAADFAISFIKFGKWSFACSAIKHGEYWANGLPIVLTDGVGSESSWLQDANAGANINFFEKNSITDAVNRILKIFEDPEHRTKIRKIGLEKRGKSHLIKTYEKILDSISL